ncbi:MAG TPA: flagellar assembly protein FliW [Firmicutes bacterium]|jgi:flagellar assembly factor FliW|nr:flagellar assembly protein FliW [Bacillota bacterium]
MKIATKFFDVIEVDEKEFINFNHGIPGFEDFHQYIIKRYKDQSPFLVMQSIEKADLAFILIEMEQIVPGYSIDLDDSIVAELQLNKPEEAIVRVIVTLPEDVSKATVDLAAPIVINFKTGLAKQIILNNPMYSLKHPLFATENAKEAACTVIP